MDILCEILTGSHLYGTTTEDSDKDIKGVFMPTTEQILLNKIPKSMSFDSNKTSDKNTKEDVDKEYYSLHYFIELACKGETGILDMLHCTDDCLLKTSSVWRDLINNREKFYSKKMRAFVGYARSQAAKYGIKGDRIESARELKKFLSKWSKHTKLSAIWTYIGYLKLKHLHFKEGVIRAGGESVRELIIGGKIIQETVTVEYALEILNNFLDKYGKRAFLAEHNRGIDWKAISHSIRIATELKMLYQKNTIKFPLYNAEFLTQVKKGERDYKTEVAPVLDSLMEEIELLSEKSEFPEKVNRKFWDGWLLDIIEDMLYRNFAY